MSWLFIFNNGVKLLSDRRAAQVELGLIISFFCKSYFQVPDVLIAALTRELEGAKDDIIHR